MPDVPDSERRSFFEAVNAAAKQAVYCALATQTPDGPRVRIVHPTWEGETLWFATGASSPKTAQLRRDQRVDLQFQVAPPDFAHLMVRGEALLVEANMVFSIQIRVRVKITSNNCPR
jgi:general stress protein 26